MGLVYKKKTLNLFLGSTLTTNIEILTGHQNTLEYRDMSKKRNIIFENVHLSSSPVPLNQFN